MEDFLRRTEFRDGVRSIGVRRTFDSPESESEPESSTINEHPARAFQITNEEKFDAREREREREREWERERP